MTTREGTVGAGGSGQTSGASRVIVLVAMLVFACGVFVFSWAASRSAGIDAIEPDGTAEHANASEDAPTALPVAESAREIVDPIEVPVPQRLSVDVGADTGGVDGGDVRMDVRLRELRNQRNAAKDRWTLPMGLTVLTERLGLPETAADAMRTQSVQDNWREASAIHEELIGLRTTSVDAKIAAGDVRSLLPGESGPSPGEVQGGYHALVVSRRNPTRRLLVILRPGDSADLDDAHQRYSAVIDSIFDELELYVSGQ